MIEFAQALMAAYAASTALKAAFPGGFWADIAPEGTPLPYLVFNIQAAPVVQVYGGESSYRPTVRFAGYGDRSQCGPGNEAFAAVDAAVAATLSVAGKTVDWYLAQGKPIARYVGKTKTGGDLWQTAVVYDYSVS